MEVTAPGHGTSRLGGLILLWIILSSACCFGETSAENPLLGITRFLILDRESSPIRLPENAGPEATLDALLKAAKNRRRTLLLIVLSGSSPHATSFFSETIQNEEFFPWACKKYYLAVVLAEQQKSLVRHLGITRVPSTFQFDQPGRILSVFVGNWKWLDLQSALGGDFPAFAEKTRFEEASDPLCIAEFDPILYSRPETMTVQARQHSAIEKLKIGMTRREVQNLVGEARNIRTMGKETLLTIAIPLEKKIDEKTTRYIHQLWHVVLIDGKVTEISKVPQD